MTRTLYFPGGSQLPQIEDPQNYGEIKALIGGWLESVPLPPEAGVSGYCDEEGKLKGLGVNSQATALLDDLWGTVGQGPFDMLCGPVLIFGQVDKDGNDTDVPQSIINRYTERVEG